MLKAALSLITVHVSDWAAAVAWYRDKLGLEPVRLREGHYCWMKFPDGETMIGLNAIPPATKSSNWTPNIRVEDLDVTVAQLKERGVEFTTEITGGDEGYREAVLKDVEGNSIALHELTGA